MLLGFVDTSLSAEEVGDLLTMAGFELEGIEEVEDHPVLDIKVMSNRGDGLSIFGLAREVLAKDSAAKPTELYVRAAERFSGLNPGLELPQTSVSIQTEACKRFACLMLTNVSRKSSEDWMQQSLRRAGMRPISLMVDITNYVMLELGQPLHAYDFEKLAGGRIVVREAQPNETITTLNGVEHNLQAGQMMICDAERPVGVAGVMGGADSEVSETTTTVLLESANFLNTSVRKTRKQLGLSTEASYRFERSVDPDGVVAALIRCVDLVKQADPGVTSTAVIDHYPGKIERSSLTLRTDRASKLLGMPITAEQAEHYLSRLGFKASIDSANVLTVMPPTWRPDIVREEDLVEELGRVHGYELIPEQLLEGTTKMGGPQGFELWTDWLREACLRSGLSQTISHSLRDIHPLDEVSEERLGPRTPASPDTAYLRNSLLPSLADAARRNGAKDIHVFELGRVFAGEKGKYVETIRLGGLSCGPIEAGGWSLTPSGTASFFTLKGTLEEITLSVGVSISLTPPEILDARFHPTRQATIVASGTKIGVIGQLHPDIAHDCGLPVETVAFEILAREAYESRNASLKLSSVSRHPAVRRDVSVLADKTVSYETISRTIAQSVGSILEHQWLFDEFTGQGIPEGKRALGIALQLRKLDSTFTDEEANQVREIAVAALGKIGATTR